MLTRDAQEQATLERRRRRAEMVESSGLIWFGASAATVFFYVVHVDLRAWGPTLAVLLLLVGGAAELIGRRMKP